MAGAGYNYGVPHFNPFGPFAATRFLPYHGDMTYLLVTGQVGMDQYLEEVAIAAYHATHKTARKAAKKMSTAELSDERDIRADQLARPLPSYVDASTAAITEGVAASRFETAQRELSTRQQQDRENRRREKGRLREDLERAGESCPVRSGARILQ